MVDQLSSISKLLKVAYTNLLIPSELSQLISLLYRILNQSIERYNAYDELMNNEARAEDFGIGESEREAYSKEH